MSADDLRGLVRPDVLEQEALAALGRRLRAGAACVIRDALLPERAEAFHRALAAATGWEVRAHEAPQSGWRRREMRSLPEPLGELQGALSSERTRQLMAELSGVRCDAADWRAESYGPGDYRLPYANDDHARTLSVLWLANRDWDPAWGGHFCWSDPFTFVVPTFNMLILFAARRSSQSFVTPVAPHATRGRLAFCGGYTSRAHPAEPAARKYDWSLGPLDELGPGIYVGREEP